MSLAEWFCDANAHESIVRFLRRGSRLSVTWTGSGAVEKAGGVGVGAAKNIIHSGCWRISSAGKCAAQLSCAGKV